MADADVDSDEARVLRPLQPAACTYRIAFRPRAGQKVLTVQGAKPRDADFKQALCADIQGFSLHAAVRCGADDRLALEQLCRYTTRPALVNERVQTNAAGQVMLKLSVPPVNEPRHEKAELLLWRSHPGWPVRRGLPEGSAWGRGRDRLSPCRLGRLQRRGGELDGPSRLCP